MFKRIMGLILGIAFVLNYQCILVHAAENPSHEEIEKIIEEVAVEKNIPAVILKAIAWKESNYRQFDSNGNPFISNYNTGIMQINKVHKDLDQNLLKNDIRYNIEAGADILLNRFNSMGKIIPTIGDKNPQVLENWYFALWGYNGWSSRNNPNINGAKVYQEKVFELIRTRYNQPVTSISSSLLPKSELPSSDFYVETPVPYHDLSLVLNKTEEITEEIKIEVIVEEQEVKVTADAFVDSVED